MSRFAVVIALAVAAAGTASAQELIATLAQAHGATLVGLGFIDWLARAADRRGARAVLAGNLVVQALSLVVVLRTMTLGAGAAVAPGVVIHVALGGLFAFFLARPGGEVS